jgi:hypothetical protein
MLEIMSILLGLIAFFFVTLSYAENCATVNLITEENSPFTGIPMIDQKKSNICYALSAAQLGDYYLMKNGAKKRSLHPAWLALSYAQSKGRSTLDIGHVKDALEMIQGKNNCPYDQVAKALLGEDNTQSEIEVLMRIGRSFPSPVDALSGLLSSSCNEKNEVRFPPIQRYSYRELPDERAIESFLIKRLSTDRPLPLSIAYCSKMLKDPGYLGIDTTPSGIRDIIKNDCDYHESLIVGRKEMNSRCHLLLRNSWGDTWRSGNKKWSCLCRDRSSGKFEDNCTALTHPDDRYSVEACWIPSVLLSKNVGAITFLEGH